MEGEREERLDAQPAAFPHERRVPGVVLLAGLDRDEPPCADRLGDGAAEVEGIHGEPGAGLLGDRGRAEGLERRVVPRAPDEDDVRVCALELRDDRLPDLGHRHGGGEARGGLFHHLRLTARGALRLVRAEQPALGRRSCPGERAEHQREDRSADEDGERRGMRHSAAARRDDEPSVGERDQPRLPAARRIVRLEQLLAAQRDASSDVGREARERVHDRIPSEPRAHEPDRRVVVVPGGIVDGADRLQPSATEDEREGAGHRVPPRSSALERAATSGLALEVVAEERRARAGVGPDRGDRDVRLARIGAAEDTGAHRFRDSATQHDLEGLALPTRNDLGEAERVDRTARPDRTRVRPEALDVDLSLGVDEPGGRAETREDPAEVALERLAGRQGGAVVLDPAAVVGACPQEPGDRDGRHRHERDEGGTERSTPRREFSPGGDSTRAASPSRAPQTERTRKSPPSTCRATLWTGTVPILPDGRPWCAWPWNTASGRCAPIGADRRPEPRNAQILRLADDGLDDRRVMEEHEAPVAPGDRLEPGLERVDLARRLGVDVAEQALAEVGDLGAGEAADEALHADDAHLHAGELEHHVRTVEHCDPRVAERRLDRRLEAVVVVVVAEHGDDRRGGAPARVGEHGSLVGQPVRREVARQQDEVDVGQASEGTGEALAVLLRRVEVADSRDAQLGHDAHVPAPRRSDARGVHLARTGYADGFRRRSEVNDMPMWAWILLIILLVLLLTGGIGYGRR